MTLRCTTRTDHANWKWRSTRKWRISRKKEKDHTRQVFERRKSQVMQARKDQRAAEIKPAIIKHLASEMLKDNNGQETSDPEQLEIKTSTIAEQITTADKRILEGLEGEVSTLGKASGELENLDTEIKGLSRSRDKRADDLRDVQAGSGHASARYSLWKKPACPDAPSQVFRISHDHFRRHGGICVGLRRDRRLRVQSPSP